MRSKYLLIHLLLELSVGRELSNCQRKKTETIWSPIEIQNILEQLDAPNAIQARAIAVSAADANQQRNDSIQ
jgi:hypothetical protein